ncbi:sensor histidine kinase [Vagococcus fessus]|uniref:histidine kinase n=1 Tax=Vagococcus fessus TaxID=120370 RepID=A0A430AC54_9ENTE|nr:sensor histidine kinase [Vagococcus fessus]RSU04802.1 hypothetical protein CBF31_01935 [Vagococcus fessus]
MHETLIRKLCKEYSNLSPDDVDEIVNTANGLENSILYQGEDVFIDILSTRTDEAIVVYHRKPTLKNSLYKDEIVGKIAKRLNEPGVYRTFETSLKTEGLLGKTQENKMIRQKVFPIRNNQKNIGVIIVESPFAEAVEERDYRPEKNVFDDGTGYNYPKANLFYQSFIEKLDEAILVFDKDGYLVMNNSVADSYYYHFGYMERIKGFHYDNLSLDTSTFEQLLYLLEVGRWDEVSQKKVMFGESHFEMKRFFEKDNDLFVMILHDKTEIYNKEVEIITKSVAIKEIHHRVKNNLQSIVSLLRIQRRRLQNEEASKILNESENRVLAISSVHEMLSKQIEDDILLSSVLHMIINNVQRVFLGTLDVILKVELDETISLDSDRTVTVALIVNELLQNSFEHAFNKDVTDNKISISLSKEGNDFVKVTVKDNGTGYDSEAIFDQSLGLQIVSSYVKDKLRGKLQISSSEDGTTTCFYFKTT